MAYEIGARLRRYREARKLSQKEFAALIGVSNSRVSNWEQGINRPDVDILSKICEVLMVSPSELLDFNLTDKAEPNLKRFETEEILRQLSVEYNLSDDERDMIQKFLSLNPEQRKIISNYTHFISTQVENNQENNLK